MNNSSNEQQFKRTIVQTYHSSNDSSSNENPPEILVLTILFFLKCLILPDFLRIKPRINEISNFCESKIKVSIELKISSLMSYKMFTFLRAFQIFLVQNAANNSKFIELQSFLLTIVKIKGKGMPNILLFILYHDYGGRRGLSFT